MSIITDHACKGQTLVDRVKYWGKTKPDTPAFIFWSPAGRRLLSRGDLLDLSSSFAYRLAQHGVKPGNVVCIALPNSLHRVVVEFGINLAGAVSVNGQVLRADGEDLIGTLIKSNCSCIVLDPDQTFGAWQVLKHAFDSYEMYEIHAEIQSQRIPSLTSALICRPSGSKNGFLENLNEESMIYEGNNPQDTCAIFTTSGSTGYSKLVPQTHEAVLTFDYQICQMLGLYQGTKYFDSSPFGWLGGFPTFYLYSGCTQVALDEERGEIPNKAAFTWDVLNREKVRYALLVPAILDAVNEQRRASQEQHESFRMSNIITAGQPITKENLSVVGELTDAVTVAYGSVECCLAARIKIDSTNIQSFQDDMGGYPFAGVRLKIVDKHLNILPPLSRGGILLQSPTLSHGYIGSEAASKANFLPDGWFTTGDIGFLREDGCLFVEGRSSDAIMHGAYILYPTWLEQILVKCPGVKDIVIVPVPDKVLHHEICACVQLDDSTDGHPSAEDIIKFCQSEIALHKSSSLNVIPKYVIFVTEFPQTNTNKLNRRGMADLAKERLQL